MDRNHKNYYECFFNDLYALYYKRYVQDANARLESRLALMCGSNEVIARPVKYIVYVLLNIAFLSSLPVYYIYGFVVFAYLYSKIIFSTGELIDEHFSGEIALVFDEISYERVRTFNKNYTKSVPVYGDFFNSRGNLSIFNFFSVLKKIYLIPEICFTGNLILFKSLSFYRRYDLPFFWNYTSRLFPKSFSIIKYFFYSLYRKISMSHIN